MITLTLKKVLVVDDSELLHRMYDLVFMRFKAEGAEILHAHNGLEAFAMLEEHPDVEIMVLDINMPVMDGLQFLEERRKRGVFIDLPVVIVSTEGREQDTVKGLEAGASAYVKKPFQPSDLLAMIEKVLSQSARQVG